MKAPFSQLKSLKLKAEGSDFPVRDLAFDPQATLLHCVLTDVGGFLSSKEAIIPARHLGEADPSAGVWQTSLTEKDIEDAPVLSDSAPAPDLTHMPPLIVGPFGTTQSPLLLAAQMAGEPDDDTRDLPDRIELWSDWSDALVFGPEGELARLVDLHVDLTTMAVTEAMLNCGETTFAVPITAIRNFVQGEGYAVTDLTLGELRSGITVGAPGPALPDPSRTGWVPV